MKRLIILTLIMLLLTNNFAILSGTAKAATHEVETISRNSSLFGFFATLTVGFLLNRRFEAPRIEDWGKEQLEEGVTEFEELSSEELQSLLWLGQLITGEARGEPYLGKVAVAAVILNRVADPRFPNSVYDVVHAERQFAALTDRQAFLEADESAYRAAREAMDGHDPTNGAIYFYNPHPALHSSGIDWLINNTQKLMEIGSHVFAK